MTSRLGRLRRNRDALLCPVCGERVREWVSTPEATHCYRTGRGWTKHPLSPGSESGIPTTQGKEETVTEAQVVWCDDGTQPYFWHGAEPLRRKELVLVPGPWWRPGAEPVVRKVTRVGRMRSYHGQLESVIGRYPGPEGPQ